MASGSKQRLPNAPAKKAAKAAPGPAGKATAPPAGAKGAAKATAAKASTQTAAQKRLAAQRAMAAASGASAARRKRLILVLSPVLAVVLVAALLVGIKLAGGSGVKSGAKGTQASAQVVAAVSGVPASVSNTIGAGTISTPPTALTGAALTVNGLPRILYVGAEYCPYCAAERWSLAVALARFGTIKYLGETTSSPTDVYPSTRTLSFYGTTVTSKYFSFTAKEIYSNQANSAGTGYTTLDTLDAADQSLFTSKGGGSFPFVDIGGKYMISGASYDAGVLKGLTWAQIATDLSNPDSAVAKAVVGTANVVTAAICKITGSAPSNVCTSAGVVAGAAKLPHAAT